MPKVYITNVVPDLLCQTLQKNGFEVEKNKSGEVLTKPELIKAFASFDAVVTLVCDNVDEEVINASSANLKIISNYAVGFDNIDVLAAKRKGIVVTNTPGVAGESVAEHTFALILACAKSLVAADRYTRQGKFQKWDAMAFLSHQIWGQTIGIVGLGRIGTYVGHIANGGFRMKILYSDVVRSDDFEMITGATFCKLEDLLKQSDIVTLHVPLLPSTKHLIGKDQFKMMKNDAILINTSRGPVVDEAALMWALENKEIAGAGLDVYEHEPNIPQELLALGNIVLTPHIASATYETRDAMAKIAAENIIDVFSGKTPLGLVKAG